jgi:hypothetical protein
MIHEYRNLFNQHFTRNGYEQLNAALTQILDGPLAFRVAETPVFVPAVLRDSMTETCDRIIDFIHSPNFLTATQQSIPNTFLMNGDEKHPRFLVFDFAITTDEYGNRSPKLIEMQGFPSLFGFQHQLDLLYRKYNSISTEISSYLNNFEPNSYVQMLKDIIVSHEDPNEVILMDLEPEKQKTYIDFKITQQLLGIHSVCISKLIQENGKIYYKKEGKKIEVKRIFNRFVPDEWNNKIEFNWQKEMDVEWLNHPHAYYRISKFLLPFIKHPNVPESYFLSEFSNQIPLENAVLKPLYSFGGNGVILDVTQNKIDEIADHSAWIIQRKVNYASIIETPDEPAKTEIRLFYFYPNQTERPIAVHNLARISKGAMIGTQFNKNKEWVGGSLAYFRK